MGIGFERNRIVAHHSFRCLHFQILIMRLIIPILAILCCVACESLFENTITFDDIHEPQLAVTAVLDDLDSIHQIFVSTTLPPTGAAEYKALTSATVVLSIEGITYHFSYNEQTSYYEHPTTLPFRTNEEWQLEVRHPDLPTVTAFQRVPSPLDSVQMDTLNTGKLVSNYTENFNNQLRLRFQDNESSNDLYLITSERSGVSLNRSDSTYVFQKNRPGFVGLRDIEELHNRRGRTYFNDEMINGQFVDMEVFTFASLDTIYQLNIGFYSITHERYQYDLKNDQFRDAQQNLFTEPVSTFTNVENGVGIFSVSRSFEYVVE